MILVSVSKDYPSFEEFAFLGFCQGFNAFGQGFLLWIEGQVKMKLVITVLLFLR